MNGRTAMTEDQPPARFPFVGNHPCVDFVNTEVVGGEGRIDLLAGYPDLVRWLAAARLLSGTEARAALRLDAHTAAGAALAAARRLRALLRGALESAAAGKPIPGAVLAEVNAALARRRG